MFEKWERDQAVTLKRNDSYWGDKAKVERVIIRTISDPKARTQELQAGTIDGYDLVGPADVQPLKDAGFQIQNRPAFNILYLGINQKNKALQDVRVRQAIGHAIDKAAVVKSSLPEGSVPAKEFMPNLVDGLQRLHRPTRRTTSRRRRSCSRKRARRTWSSSSPTRRASPGRTCRPRRTPSR